MKLSKIQKKDRNNIMPYSFRKTKKGCIQVYNIKTRKVYSKCTTQKKSEKQLRLLRALEYNPDFKLRKPNSSKRKTVKRRF